VALALVASQQPDANLWRITRGFPETDINGNLVDHDKIWYSIGGYATQVVELVDFSWKYKACEMPPKPEGERSSDESGEGKGDDDEVKCSNGQDEASSPPPAV
jgi:hypothetical protein